MNNFTKLLYEMAPDPKYKFLDPDEQKQYLKWMGDEDTQGLARKLLKRVDTPEAQKRHKLYTALWDASEKVNRMNFKGSEVYEYQEAFDKVVRKIYAFTDKQLNYVHKKVEGGWQKLDTIDYLSQLAVNKSKRIKP